MIHALSAWPELHAYFTHLKSPAAVRVRFAPSPTGFMHLGNVRAATITALFAHANSEGTFIVRIEDTDPERNFDPRATTILKDLSWLGLHYDEGPGTDSAYAPYFQSERTPYYQRALEYLHEQQLVYRCFCTPEMLEIQRNRQIAQKRPPRYERTCLELSPATIADYLSQNKPHIWRLKMPNDSITLHDLAHKTLTFDYHHFSDCTLTRTDGSFTFLFANAVDDIIMNISHVIRGEDHLSNTASQAVLYRYLQAPLPIFWHLPIMRNTQGKKLSKRDFGFALKDLRSAGYLPEAIINYVGIVGTSFIAIPQDFHTLANHLSNLMTTSPITYDPEQLKTLNKSWLQTYTIENIELLLESLACFDETAWNTLSSKQKEMLWRLAKQEIATVCDLATYAPWLWHAPDAVPLTDIALKTVLTEFNRIMPQDSAYSVATLQQMMKNAAIMGKQWYPVVRTLLTGNAQGMGIHDIWELLGAQEIHRRFGAALTL